MSTSPSIRRLRQPPRFAKAQLTLVEHALCPLDAATSLKPNLLFETQHLYTDRNSNRKEAHVRIGALDGLSATDELYLWGLLSLALSQAEPQPELMATPYYCLRHLGVADNKKPGGREFQLFRSALQRLAGVRYQNDAFYDPIRGEHRQVAFGLLSYSLPLDSQSSRAWRFAWDPIFFEFAQATGGALSFDIGLYRQLDVATRRLYLYVKKLFWRREMTDWLELRHLAVDVLGFAATVSTKHLKAKVVRCVEQLVERGLVQWDSPDGQPFQKRGKGIYRIRLMRGPDFNASPSKLPPCESPLADPLRAIGFDESALRRILATYSHRSVEQWTDITLAAREKHGEDFFKRSPQAYFLNNLKAAAAGRRTPPDWWHDLRRQERKQELQQEEAKVRLLGQPRNIQDDFEQYLKTEAQEMFSQLTQQLARDLCTSGQPEHMARENADRIARGQLRHRYRLQHGDRGEDGFTRAASSLL